MVNNKTFESYLAQGFFARHETFCPRYGWLKKGFDAVTEDPKIFDRPDAIERLGVGKNMVRSIRFWCLAFKLIEPLDRPGPFRLSGKMRPTELAEKLLTDDGWDPYLENPASLWLLHWQLFTQPISATAWSLVFNMGYIGSFTVKELERALKEQITSHKTVKQCSDSSIAKDASCLIRMYAPLSDGRVLEGIECPFTELNLLSLTEEKQTYRFNLSGKNSLPVEIFLAACCDYHQNAQMELAGDQKSSTTKGAMSLSLNKATFGFNSPGVVFKLPETEVGYLLEKASQQFSDYVKFTEFYGSRQLQFLKNPRELYWLLLKQYYEKN